ncbi:MAG: prolipoprotein diacylglyceryl transferase [Actinobacteria bacterium]|nr:prolipoprotein diacylglyceryl transferase [Actinomycetota bacterium]
MHAVIPSPTQGVWYLGPFPLRAYALCIIAGIILAVRMGEKRYAARGGEEGVVLDIAAWAVPFGIVGGRIYHVVTSPGPYFGEGGSPVKALYIWQGGLGIWGAVALGALGAYIGARRRGVYLPPLADALAPGILAAQALGRWGNYFNNELFGRPTDLPWALKIYEWDQSAGQALRDSTTGAPIVDPDGPFHPTFLYESLWNAAGVALLLWADRRFRLGHGRLFALYIAVYTSGRLWIEALRIDEATKVLGLRINIWTSIIVLVGAIVAFVVVTRRKPGRDGVLVRPVADPSDDEPDLMADLKDDAKDAKDDAKDASDAEAADAKVKDALAGDSPVEKTPDAGKRPGAADAADDEAEDPSDGGTDNDPDGKTDEKPSADDSAADTSSRSAIN